MEQNSHRLIREHLVQQLGGGEAFIRVEELLNEIEFEDLGKRPAGLPYSFYEQFFHLRASQFDIMDFCKNEDYQPQKWPDDFWPVEQAPENETAWEELKTWFLNERDEMMNLILDEENDLTATTPNGEGQTLLQEILLMLAHNAYHIGQLAIIFRLLNREHENEN